MAAAEDLVGLRAGKAAAVDEDRRRRVHAELAAFGHAVAHAFGVLAASRGSLVEVVRLQLERVSRGASGRRAAQLRLLAEQHVAAPSICPGHWRSARPRPP